MGKEVEFIEDDYVTEVNNRSSRHYTAKQLRELAKTFTRDDYDRLEYDDEEFDTFEPFRKKRG